MPENENLETAFLDIYTKFKLHFYRKIFNRFETREASLTAVETFCVEVINALDKPTVNEFAKFVDISQANAAYKIQSLIEKGYVVKIQSETDRREFHLLVTEKFHHYNSYNVDYVGAVSAKMRQRFDKTSIDNVVNIMNAITNEIMPEIEYSAKDI